MNQPTDLTLKDAIERLDKTYDLIYIDYRESLDDHLTAVQTAIQTQDKFSIDESLELWEWYIESRDDAVDYAVKELRESLESDFDFEEDELDYFMEDNIDEIRMAIEDRDVSNPLDDLLRNTSESPIFFDLGVDVEDTTFMDDNDFRNLLKEVKKALKIKLSDRTFDSRLTMMLYQASYGGRLVVYFTESFENLMDLKGANRITFENPMVAVIDTFNGSGDNTDLDGHKFTVPFDPTNLFIDKTIKYNYSFAVCGMSSNWCDSTRVSFSKTNRTRKASPSSLHAELDREKQLNEVYKAGGCTFGDIDIRRHRNTVYINDFPCGTRCRTCGTFWID